MLVTDRSSSLAMIVMFPCKPPHQSGTSIPDCTSDFSSFRDHKWWNFKLKESATQLFPIFAGSLEAAYSLNWGAQKIWGKSGGETLALL